MKIKVVKADCQDVLGKKHWNHVNPSVQTAFWRRLLALVSKGELKDINFRCEYETDAEKLKNQPVLYLMNHSCFTDLMIAANLLKDHQYHIICTNDGFIGKAGLMRKIGCIPTRKFITDVTLVKDMKYCVDKLGSSILLFPEASYSFDGTETPLPTSMGKCVKMLNVPVVMIRTTGAFLRDPLYNNLQKRKVDVSAKVSTIVSPEELAGLSADEISKRIAKCFEYDHFKEQKQNNVTVSEAFRADGLHRVLYKCAKCKTEGKMHGEGIKISCKACGDTHELLVDGTLKNMSGTDTFTYVTDWYKWERECVRQEVLDQTFESSVDVRICVLADEKAIYEIGEGKLSHNMDGFTLTGCDGKLLFTSGSKASYSLYADYFWYEIGDMVCIGDSKHQFYCFPKSEEYIVAKERLATEEIYKSITG